MLNRNKMLLIRNKKRKQQGFTLIELMVSVAIFAMVTLMTSGSFIVLANIYRKVQSNRAIVDNLNLAMDTMTLQIREGRDYRFTSCGGDPTTCIKFDEYIINGSGQYQYYDTISYYIDEDQGVLYQHRQKDDSDIALTSPDEIHVDSLSFHPTATKPYLVTVVIKGTAKNKEGLQSDFLLQTSLSQRNTQID
ncbi:MAG: prepilin-type N-terminal cleavage/methylation domain-containing protein [Patescibacteria group bacterium]